MSEPRGRLVVVSAPSGAGKTTLVRGLLERDPRFVFSVSYTTRARRPNERDGHDYHFVTPERFRELQRQGAFLEHAEVFDNFYATGRDAVEQELERGKHVIVEIDWQGAQQVREKMPSCRSIFIVPPSVAALRDRLTQRQTDSAAVIERRLRDSLDDLSHWPEFDYIVVNDDLETALDELAGLASGRFRRNRVGTQRVTRIMGDILDS
ncbi:MAG: guanylate kinase, partial [Pseudomonadota bacterium]